MTHADDHYISCRVGKAALLRGVPTSLSPTIRAAARPRVGTARFQRAEIGARLQHARLCPPYGNRRTLIVTANATAVTPPPARRLARSAALCAVAARRGRLCRRGRRAC